MELVESQPLLEWLANNYKSFGATLEIITDKSQEGSQFVRGFGGIGGEILFFCLFGVDGSWLLKHYPFKIGLTTLIFPLILLNCFIFYGDGCKLTIHLKI